VDEAHLAVTGSQRGIESGIDAGQRFVDVQSVQVDFGRRAGPGSSAAAVTRCAAGRRGAVAAVTSLSATTSERSCTWTSRRRLLRTSRTTPFPCGVCTASPGANRVAIAFTIPLAG
jgi:hypothetical protein